MHTQITSDWWIEPITPVPEIKKPADEFYSEGFQPGSRRVIQTRSRRKRSHVEITEHPRQGRGREPAVPAGRIGGLLISRRSPLLRSASTSTRSRISERARSAQSFSPRMARGVQAEGVTSHKGTQSTSVGFNVSDLFKGGS